MSRSPRITVVTPSFNQGCYLEQTICSVLDQAYPNLEYMVIDGLSKDNSQDIIRRYSSRLTYWVSEKDNGQTEAINKGFTRATGDILAYLNSDDFYLPGTLAQVAAFFDSHPDVDVMYGGCRYVNDKGVQLFEHHPPDFNYERLLLGNTIPQPATFWRRRVLERVGPLDSSLHYVMDYEFWLRCALKGCRFGSVPDILAVMRRHAGAKTVAVETGFGRETLAVFERLFYGETSSRFSHSSVQKVSSSIEQRAYGRVLWQQAVALEEAGKRRDAREMTDRAFAAVDVLAVPEDLAAVLNRMLHLGSGGLLSPRRYAARMLCLGLTRGALLDEVEDEYLRRFLEQIKGDSSGRRLFRLLVAACVRPQFLRFWQFRRVLLRWGIPSSSRQKADPQKLKVGE